MNRPHERRLDRALYHLEDFKAEWRAWLEERPHRFWTELDAERGKKVVWAEVVKPPPTSLGLIAGDCIHNLRAALDNLAFELALAGAEGPLSSKAERDSGFPIFDKDPTEGTDPRPLRKFDNMIRCISPRAQAAIQRLQPYCRGEAFHSDPLWQLNELSNVEKHRLPHTATLNNVSTLTFFVPDGIGAEEVQSLFAWFDGSAPIAQYPAFDSTGAEVHVDFTPAFDVAFTKGAPQRLWGRSIPGTLESFQRYIVNEVLPPLVDSFLD